ncbi:LytTR family DNA-binding domain-containing protein [Lactobacillus sp. YT155]|uniref:LytTR family DNA-binding domain-containing protein n=1 Tax=Lactobacillus sp. YT155 TaxID=3060955 RepID=UPI00265DA4F8|nr:LytTR family DNA-binding domain-containing protein [Lactobacillus sp. YT155]MDO1605798.1 LytTR family DNA-binding domain-containing protein [Lactobacillus sp. YT155]
MKIKVEIDQNINDTEIIIKSAENTEKVTELKKQIKELIKTDQQLLVIGNDKEYQLSIDEILFFEISDRKNYVHTEAESFITRKKLMELEEILPNYFVRSSKSSIVNTRKIYSISKSITGTVIGFQNSVKQQYVSRKYYRQLKNKLEKKEN